MARKKRTAIQRLNEAITGTNYCGPGTSTDQPPVSELDAACQRHDSRVSGFSDPFGEGDQLFLDELEQKGMTDGSYRQAITKGIAKTVFSLKKKLKAQEQLDCPIPGAMDYLSDLPMLEGPVNSNRKKNPNAKMPRIRSKSVSRKRKGTRSKSRSRKRVYKKRVRFSKSRRIKRTTKTPKVTKTLVRKINAKQLSLQAPLWYSLITRMTCDTTQNIDRWFEPTILQFNTLTDHSTVQTLLYNDLTNEVKFSYSTTLDCRLSNGGNTTYQFTIYRVKFKKSRKAKDYTKTPLNSVINDTASEPGVADTFSEQPYRFDMHKSLAGALTAMDATMNPDGGNQLDCDVDVTKFPYLKNLWQFKKIHEAVMTPYSVKYIQLKARAFVKTKLDLATTAGYAYEGAPVYHIVHVKAWPRASTTTTEACRPVTSLVWHIRKSMSCRGVDNTMIQSPVIYHYTTGVSTKTDGDVFFDAETLPAKG